VLLFFKATMANIFFMKLYYPDMNED